MSCRLGVVVYLELEAPARAHLLTPVSDREERRVLLDLLSRSCVECEITSAVGRLIAALLDRADDDLTEAA